jgi:hypothetical protein
MGYSGRSAIVLRSPRDSLPGSIENGQAPGNRLLAPSSQILTSNF